MSSPRFVSLALTLTSALVLVGCGKSPDAADGHGHGHGHEGEAAAGASFKEGEGIRFSAEVRTNLGVELADVTERSLPQEIKFTAQIFGEKHHHLADQIEHSGCDVHGSGLLTPSDAELVQPGNQVEFVKGGNTPLRGVVLTMQKAPALGETEVVIGVSNAATQLRPGEFVPAVIRLAREPAVIAVPRSAVLRTATGAFVYLVNGAAYLRTPVQVGAQSGGWVEVAGELLVGDQVVTEPVQSLWLIELRATKGGGHSH